KLLDAKEARSQYQEIVRKARDPALLEWVGTGMYQTSVFPIPAGESRVVSIEYEQVLRSRDGLTEFFFPMRAGKYTVKPIDKVEFSLTIVGDTEVKNVYSPTYDITTERVGKNVVKVNSKLTNQTPSSDFRLFFDQNADDLSAKIQSYRPDDQDDGYFMLLASPKIVSEESEPLPKTIVFALDVSGSMTGQKIKQARESLEFVLKRLRKGDKFNIILFNGEVQSYSDKLVVVDEETRANALAYVAATRASGSTNIGEALIRSFASLDQADDSNPKYLFFLSDGEPVTGETNEMKLAQIAREKNKSKSRFFTFGVGYDVNSRLLDRFVSDGRGIGEYVKEDETIEAHVASLYSRVEEPVFTNVTFEFSLKPDADKKYITNLVYPSGDVDVFAGEQLALVGRYSAPGDVVVTALFDPVPFTFPPYLDGADDTVLTNYVRWASVHGPDTAGTQEASFLLDLPHSAATGTLLRVSSFSPAASGWRLELASPLGDLFQPAGLSGTSYLCNGILVLETASDLASLTNAPANLRATPATIENGAAVIDLDPPGGQDSRFFRPSIRSVAPAP
ncbi:MAG: VWA domain-containing protein, partial [Thermoguttaceae bacterium]|nr:VWA domain-containing protein [Thermoguttaceae bacterium]